MSTPNDEIDNNMIVRTEVDHVKVKGIFRIIWAVLLNFSPHSLHFWWPMQLPGQNLPRDLFLSPNGLVIQITESNNFRHPFQGSYHRRTKMMKRRKGTSWGKLYVQTACEKATTRLDLFFFVLHQTTYLFIEPLLHQVPNLYKWTITIIKNMWVIGCVLRNVLIAMHHRVSYLVRPGS